MEEFINQLTSKTGIDRATAEKVVNFLKDNPQELTKLLGNVTDKLPGGIADKLPGGLGGMFGGKKEG